MLKAHDVLIERKTSLDDCQSRMSLQRRTCFHYCRAVFFLLIITTNVWFLFLLANIFGGLFDQKIVVYDPDLDEDCRQRHLSSLIFQNTSRAVLFGGSVIQNIISWLALITLSSSALSSSTILSALGSCGCLFLVYQNNGPESKLLVLNPEFIGVYLFAFQAIGSLVLFRFTKQSIYRLTSRGCGLS